MAQVRLDHVRKVYPDGFVAVSDAAFEVADGELLVLVGPSGCGKSTLLRMIAGLEAVSGGTIAIGDRIVNDIAPRDRDIAMVFQSYALYPHMSVAGNLGFGLKLRGHDKATVAARVGEAARMLGIEDLLDRKPAALSGGQRQRVALGRALVRQPQVFLLDEPLSNLDARLRAAMRVEIARLHRSLGATMVYVTHDQVEAMTLGQRIVVLDGGRIRQVDTPMALYERPADVFVATFLGSPAMNVIAGHLDADGAGFIADDGAHVPLPGFRVPQDWPGRRLLLGVRPEHLLRAEPGDMDAGAFDALVEVVEPAGNEVFVNLRLGDHALVARLPPGVLPRPGEALSLRVAVEHAHVFDGADGADGVRLEAAAGG
ncbi:sn-glycerol-3-phosphate ABC transporter ATP-binding protein UgpC [Luteimonas sp. MC1825]|uniref:ABC transporter ATP-binding protein n=1 Tax=Luteimonas sp. MC1825 TaxID=2761107 RepID=UPI0016230136|nr:sn-glycerol-3-phosphate ABC transporter ATP-binding protein UgpC [Luteimonas sp. MC1825]MBB6599406.1 sn-glycerol-3-phosphate ABC transporter ATP-binding protein UgpC [Luteimonas sp. MC1825]QOC89527.1 sn-glycerol-3-phosphate ABC transporter ATP-binding protein UgpC [Luteimonas sp. MC1825]